MSQSLLQQFHAERARRFEEAARKVLEGQDVDAGKKYLEWVDTSTKLFAPTQQVIRRKWSLMVLALCVVLVGLAWTLRIPFTHVALDLTTGNVMLTLQDAWTCDQQFVVEKVFINNLVELQGNIIPTGTTSASIELQGSGIRLEDLTLAAGAEIELSIRDHEVQLFVKQSALSGTLHAQNATLILADQEPQQITSEIPETISFETSQAGKAPILLTLITREDWRLRGLQAQTLRFVEEYPPDSGNFVSVITSGKIMLRETELTKELRETDYLTLQKPHTEQLELSNAEDGVNVRFDGSAAAILAGSQKFRQNLTPTWFEYLARQKRVSMFWSAVIFLSGVIWKIRETLLG